MSEHAPRASIWSSGLWAFFAAIAMLGWIAWQNRMEDTAEGRAPYDRIVGVSSPEETKVLQALLDTGYGVLRSSEFQANLRALGERYPAIYARDNAQSATAAEIADIVALKPLGSRFAPAQVELTRIPGGLGAAGEGAVSGRYADVHIDRVVLGAWRAADPVFRSCAVNVAAHEYAHTIVLTPMGFGIAFTDSAPGEDRIANRRRPDTPVASYLIGAVAQCTWLQQQGRIDRREVAACVEVFGTAAFNADRCRQFEGGQPVAPRPGLAPASPPL